jgi:hypothetical protein
MVEMENTDGLLLGRYAALDRAAAAAAAAAEAGGNHVTWYSPGILRMTVQRVNLDCSPSPTVTEEYLDLLAAGRAATDLPTLRRLFEGGDIVTELSSTARVRAFAEYMCWVIVGGVDTVPFIDLTFNWSAKQVGLGLGLG